MYFEQKYPSYGMAAFTVLYLYIFYHWIIILDASACKQNLYAFYVHFT